MKAHSCLCNPTLGLTGNLEFEGEQANWVGFRSHQSGQACRELVEALRQIQHGLCGYCEIDITERDRQVEHVIPQSDSQEGSAQALDATNMMACCLGGTLGSLVSDDDARRQDPVRRNLSCGQAKGELVAEDFLDPREVPALPSVMEVGYDGRIRANELACEKANIDVRRVDRTIGILGLNVERLRRARERRWSALSDNWQDRLHDREAMEGAARTELLPTEDNCLMRFFTTSRSYFGPLGEEILMGHPALGCELKPGSRRSG